MTLACHTHKKYIMYLCDNLKTDSPWKIGKSKTMLCTGDSRWLELRSLEVLDLLK